MLEPKRIADVERRLGQVILQNKRLVTLPVDDPGANEIRHLFGMHGHAVHRYENPEARLRCEVPMKSDVPFVVCMSATGIIPASKLDDLQMALGFLPAGDYQQWDMIDATDIVDYGILHGFEYVTAGRTYFVHAHYGIGVNVPNTVGDWVLSVGIGLGGGSLFVRFGEPQQVVETL